MYKTFAFFFILFVSAGCAADRHAQQLALHVIQVTIKYEAVVDKKAAAEKTFYREQQALIHSALVGKSEITSIDEEESKIIEKTLVYGRIRTSAERDARLAAEEIVSSNPPKILGHVIDYLVKGMQQDQVLYLDLLERQRRLTDNLQASLEKIDQQKEKLKNLRNGLTALATQPDISAQIKQIIEFGEAVQKAVQEEIKKDKVEK